MGNKEAKLRFAYNSQEKIEREKINKKEREKKNLTLILRKNALKFNQSKNILKNLGVWLNFDPKKRSIRVRGKNTRDDLHASERCKPASYESQF